MHRILKIAAFCLLFDLSACANLDVHQQTHFVKRPVKVRQHAQRDLHSWYASGAFSVIQNKKSTIVSYKWWQRSRNNYTLQMFGPLSLGLVTVRAKPGAVVLQRGKKTNTASSARILLKQQLGWDFPVKNLFYWARGLSVPGASSGQQFDSFGHLISVRQGNWQIKFSAYKSLETNIDLPQRLILTAPDIRIKLVFKNWKFAG